MSEKFTNRDLDWAMAQFGMLQYWPSDETTRAAIKTLLAKQVPHREALFWLVEQFVNHIGKWAGPAELLGVLDTKYRPLDGKPHWSTLSGYTASDGEERYYEQLPKRDEPLSIESKGMMKKLLASKKDMAS